MSTPHLKLTYFDIHGGRGEPARLAMRIGNIPFEDDRISFETFRNNKQDYPFGRVPTLTIDGITVTESNGINRYVGKLAGLYPDDPVQAAFCDEAMGATEDIIAQIVATFSIQDDNAKKAARETLVDGALTFYLQRLQALLERRGGRYFADNRLTVADLKIFVWVRNLKAGILDHIPTDIVDRVAPKLAAHFESVRNHPKIAAYYAS